MISEQRKFEQLLREFGLDKSKCIFNHFKKIMLHGATRRVLTILTTFKKILPRGVTNAPRARAHEHVSEWRGWRRSA